MRTARPLHRLFALALPAALCVLLLAAPQAPAQQSGPSLPVKATLENMPPNAALKLAFTAKGAPLPVVFTTFVKNAADKGEPPTVAEKDHGLTVASGPGPVASPVTAELLLGLPDANATATAKADLPKGAVLTLTPFGSQPVRLTRSGTCDLGR